MKTSKKGLEIIKRCEGCKLKAYQLAGEAKYTIGYGHYGVEKGLVITQAEAEAFLVKDIEKAEEHVNSYLHLYHFNQNEFDALVSFTYNVGNIKLLTKNGTRTKKELGESILLYTRSQGKVLKGLVKRRTIEYDLYTTAIVD